jgi:Spy/CpxP family protein refolding chaperone
MKRILIFSLALVAVSSVVMAQGGGAGRGGGQRGFGGMNGGPTMLNREDVAAELKLTTDQKTKIQQAIEASRPQGGGAGAGGAGGTGAGGGGGRGGFGGGRGGFGGSPEQQVALDGKLKEILSADQYKRYRELNRQQAGGFALNQEVEAKELGLTDAQRQQLQTLNQQMREEMQGMFQGGGGGGDMEAMRAEMTKLRENYGKKMLAVLTAEQKAKWDASLGKPFKFTQPGG